MKHHHCLLLVALLAVSSAHAQTIYRCGPDGRTFTQTPCAQGRAMTLDGDTRSEAQRQEAATVVEREQVLGDALRQERTARERTLAHGATTIDGRVGYARGVPAASDAPASGRKKSSASKTPEPPRYRPVSATRS